MTSHNRHLLEKRKSHTIDLVVEYLNKYGSGMPEKIARKIKRNITTVFIALAYLKKQGVVRKTQRKGVPYLLVKKSFIYESEPFRKNG